MRVGPVEGPDSVPRCLRRPAVPTGLSHVLCAVAAVAALCLGAIGITVGNTSSPTAVDEALLTAVDSRSPQLWDTALSIDFFGEPLGVMVIATVLVAICLVMGRWRLAALVVAAQGAVWAISTVLKPVFDRTIHGAHLSYPSGHTAGAAALALVVGLIVASAVQLNRVGQLLVTLGVTVLIALVAAWAQIFLDAHYATDTFGGLCLTLAVVPPLAILVDRTADWLLDRFSTNATTSEMNHVNPVDGVSAPSEPPAQIQVTRRPSGATYQACDHGSGGRRPMNGSTGEVAAQRVCGEPTERRAGS
jgi:membrane-associated phospholipid phosphatase